MEVSAPRIWDWFSFNSPLSIRIVSILNNKTELQDIQKMVAEGVSRPLSPVSLNLILLPGSVKPIIDSVFAFDDVLKAYERIMTSRAKGKVVVVVDESINYWCTRSVRSLLSIIYHMYVLEYHYCFMCQVEAVILQSITIPENLFFLTPHIDRISSNPRIDTDVRRTFI